MAETFVPLSGGCQCGAVRFRATPSAAGSICHCRMCQKAFGSFFAPLVDCGEVDWTRGSPKIFASSSVADRGFCADCGTPLSYETKFGISLAIGAFDDPDAVPVEGQVLTGDRCAAFDGLASLPASDDLDDEWTEMLSGMTNHQHPDHDTDRWPQDR